MPLNWGVSKSLTTSVPFGNFPFGSAVWIRLENLPDDKNRVISELHAHKNSESPRFECEYRIKNAEDNYRWMKCKGLAVIDENGAAYRMAGSQTDITDLKQAEEKLALMQSTMS